MPLVVKDRVKETTTTTGTGAVTLGGPAAGFQSFSVIGNGNTTYYAIIGGTEWEVGIGTYTSSGTTLSRDTVLESSNSGSLVNFSTGTKEVFVTYPAERAVYTTDTSALAIPAAGTSGNLLTSDGTNWTSAAPPTGWAQITQIATTSGTTATFSNIPQTYSEILFVFDNVSHNNGTSTSFGIELSADGTTWSSRSIITAATSSTTNAYGALHIPRYTGNSGSMVNGVQTGLTAPAQSPPLLTSFVFAWAVAGIAHARFSPGAGSFDAGTITLLGRK